MYYIYLEPELKVINIVDYPSSIFGDLIGTTKATWKELKPAAKKMFLNALVNNSIYKGTTGLKIVDCENLEPTYPLENL